MADIFISYARDDHLHAERLAHALETQGWSVWWDVSIPAGKTFHDVIGEEIETARCVIVLWSNLSVGKRWVIEEAETGKNRGILVPAIIEAGVKLPFGFTVIQAADLVGWDGSATASSFRRLVSDVAGLLGPPPIEEIERRRLAEAEESRRQETTRRQAEAKRRLEEEESRRRAAAAPESKVGDALKVQPGVVSASAKQERKARRTGVRLFYWIGGAAVVYMLAVLIYPPWRSRILDLDGPRNPAGGAQLIDAESAQPAVSAPTVDLVAEPASVRRGQSVTLTWTTTNAADVRLGPRSNLGPPVGSPEWMQVEAAGSLKVWPSETVTYELKAEGAGEPAEDRVLVQVTRSEPIADSLVGDATRLGTVVGQVTASGQPLPGAQIWYGCYRRSSGCPMIEMYSDACKLTPSLTCRPSAVTDHEGRFTLVNVAPGGGRISVQYGCPNRRKTFSTSSQIDVTAGQTTSADLSFSTIEC
jgi:hypothetical protein